MVHKVAVVMLTFNRPRELGRAIECFNRQTYENRELVVLDDLFQYPEQPSGDRWRVVSVPHRFPNMGQKLNAAMKLISPDAEYIQKFDDDDLQLPWMLEATVAALKEYHWAQSREVLEWDGATLTRLESWHRSNPHKCAYHGCWAWRTSSFWSVGGYPDNSADDQIADLLQAKYGISADVISERFPNPAYIYSREPKSSHISWLHPEIAKSHDSPTKVYQVAYDSMDMKVAPAKLEIGWDRDYAALPIPKKAAPRPW